MYEAKLTPTILFVNSRDQQQRPPMVVYKEWESYVSSYSS